MSEELFVFRKFLPGEREDETASLHDAAIEKLQTLFPGRRLTSYDLLDIGLETDCLYSETGTDSYELGLVDGEVPAIRNIRTDEVITFRV